MDARNVAADGRHAPASKSTPLRSTCLLLAVAVMAVAGCTAAGTAPAPPPVGTASGPVNAPLDAYRGFMRVSDASARAPLAEDWAARFAEYAVDPELTNSIDEWRYFRDLGVVFYGETVLVDTQISEETADRVIVTDCLDQEAATAQQNGRPLPNDPEQIRRGRSSATLILTEGAWKVSELTLFRDQSC